MEKFEYSFRIAPDILMSNNQITPQIEDIQKQFKELIRQEKWENHKIFNMISQVCQSNFCQIKSLLRKGRNLYY